MNSTRTAQIPTWCGALVDAQFARGAFDDDHHLHAASVLPTRWQRMRGAAQAMWKRWPHRKSA